MPCRITCTEAAIVAAANAGKHLMTKPLCLTLDEAADIEAAVKRRAL